MHATTQDARTFEVHGVTFHSFVTSHTGATRLAAWRADFAPHTPGQAHSMSEEEVFHCLAGTLEVELDADRFTVRAGESVLVPAGTVFRVSNDTGEPAQAWVTSLIGMRATMQADGSELAPPWAQ